MLNSVDILEINLENVMFNKLNESVKQNEEGTSAVSFSDFFDNAISQQDILPTSVLSTQSILKTGELSASNLINSATSQDYETAGSMKASDSLVKFIENHEGYSSTAYNGLDYWNDTIGYGHVIEDGENLTNLSQNDAQSLLKSDLKTYEASVNKEFEGTKLTQNQFDALVSFSYGLGAYCWQNTPKLVSDIKSGASADTLKTDFLNCAHCNGQLYKGLENRKYDEWNMFANGVYNKI